MLCNLISKYDLWIQSDNASSQYKNKLPFGLLQELSDEINLRIIRTYGAAGHEKGAIDGMSSFGVRNVLRKNIVAYVFFNKSEDIVNYLTVKNPQFSYTHVPTGDLGSKRENENQILEIPNCMKQHLIVFTRNSSVLCKEYLCPCVTCLQFKFDECMNEETQPCDSVKERSTVKTDLDDDDEVDQSEQMYDFVEVPSFVSLFSGRTIEPLYFMKVLEKGVATDNLSDPYNRFIARGERYFKGCYLKIAKSKNISFKQFQTPIVVSPDEIYDTYVDTIESLQLDINVFQPLDSKSKFAIQKASL